MSKLGVDALTRLRSTFGSKVSSQVVQDVLCELLENASCEIKSYTDAVYLNWHT